MRDVPASGEDEARRTETRLSDGEAEELREAGRSVNSRTGTMGFEDPGGGKHDGPLLLEVALQQARRPVSAAMGAGR